jgi:mannose-6-phosphate isomerase-like protein (cupin superfamily)
MSHSDPSRRDFLRVVPAAAAAVALSDVLQPAEATAQTAPASNFTVFTAQEIQDDLKALAAAPGNKSLVDSKNFVAVLTTETAKSAKEFEWHEGRDHIFQILDGSTVYQLGGTPKNAHSTKPGEWLAPESADAKTVTLNKGDFIVIPRGTPHKRSTAGTVTLLLISPMGSASV